MARALRREGKDAASIVEALTDSGFAPGAAAQVVETVMVETPKLPIRWNLLLLGLGCLGLSVLTLMSSLRSANSIELSALKMAALIGAGVALLWKGSRR
jgi:hypothetical protein